jgi:ketosteroid isomerase-like protein
MLFKKINFVFSILACCALLLMSCKPKTKTVKAVSADEIINTDKAFSEMSRKTGMKKAFIEYIDNEGILLRPNHPPIIGADAIDFLSQVNDSNYTLTWVPHGGEIDGCTNLGYTYGIYSLERKDTVVRGTYVSIWKKQKDGTWKFVLDSGNPGIGQ